MRKVSIQDIAKDLNFSRNTVSKALSNDDSVSYDTRQRIIKRAIEMGYRKLNPELAAETIDAAKERPGNIAVLARRDIADFWNRIILGISSELKKSNHNLLFNFIDIEDEQAGVLPSNIANQDIDGIILLSVFNKDFVNKLLETKLPMVFLDAPIDICENDLPADVILVEGECSVYKVTKELLEKGLKRIGFVGDVTYCRTIFDRWRGYAKALKDYNLTIDESISITKAAPKHLYDYEEVSSYLSNIKHMLEAFVCANDDIAMHVIRYLKEMGLKVPDDVKVTGFDDIRDSMLIEPALTTVHVFNEQIGARLVQELMWRINNPEMPYELVVINTKVIFRRSSEV
jgi:LacI family transcriptional regulator